MFLAWWFEDWRLKIFRKVCSAIFKPVCNRDVLQSSLKKNGFEDWRLKMFRIVCCHNLQTRACKDILICFLGILKYQGYPQGYFKYHWISSNSNHILQDFKVTWARERVSVNIIKDDGYHWGDLYIPSHIPKYEGYSWGNHGGYL